jgi:hypothetical protein
MIGKGRVFSGLIPLPVIPLLFLICYRRKSFPPRRVAGTIPL